MMPFGLINAPAAFQRMMTETLKSQLVSVFVFIDDILVCSRTLDDHLEHLVAVFKAVQEADIWLKGKKCTFVKNSVDHLNHKITAAGLLILGNHVSKLLEMRTSRSRDDLRSLLGCQLQQTGFEEYGCYSEAFDVSVEEGSFFRFETTSTKRLASEIAADYSSFDCIP